MIYCHHSNLHHLRGIQYLCCFISFLFHFFKRKIDFVRIFLFLFSLFFHSAVEASLLFSTFDGEVSSSSFLVATMAPPSGFFSSLADLGGVAALSEGSFSEFSSVLLITSEGSSVSSVVGFSFTYKV